MTPSRPEEEDLRRLGIQYFDGETHFDGDDLRLAETHFYNLRSFLLRSVTETVTPGTNGAACSSTDTSRRFRSPTTRDVVEDLVFDVMAHKRQCIVQLRIFLFMRELVEFENVVGAGDDVSHERKITDYYSSSPEQQKNSSCLSFVDFLHEKPRVALPTLSMSFVSAVYALAFTDRAKLPDIKLTTRLLALSNGSNVTLSCRAETFIPYVSMIDIKTDFIGKFITVRGHVTKARPKRLRVTSSDFSCAKCGEQFRHGFVEGRYSMPSNCPTKRCRSRSFSILRSTARYIDFQEIRLQELQDETQVDAGRAPRHIDVELVGNDLVELCNAGDIATVSGVVASINTAHAAGKGGRRASETSTYKLFIKANSLVNQTAELSLKKRKLRHGAKGDSKEGRDHRNNEGIDFTPKQLSMIAKLAHFDPLVGSGVERQSFPFDMLVRSLCPSIIGHDMVKAGLLLTLLGGTPPSVGFMENRNAYSIRSNSHILIVGDPGMGKSQMLLAATQISSRSVYVGGNTSSTTGLTVSLSKESGGEVSIEAGALVLADQGICAIDEFDKMAKSQQDGLLEAMEQQHISIAKAGVVASLPSRCSVIAAANPKSGNYNKGKTVAENISMASPLLSRFDLVFILQDNANNNQDTLVSRNIMNMYRQQNDSYSFSPNDLISSSSCALEQRLRKVCHEQRSPLPLDLVKDYIAYAREYCRPRMTAKAGKILRDYFLEQRSISRGDVPITTRQLEALIRLAQARAKACLRDFVLPEDSLDVVQLMTHSVHQVHTDECGVLDKTRGGAGGKSKRKIKRAFMDKLQEYKIKLNKQDLSIDDLRKAAAHVKCHIGDFDEMIEELRSTGELIRTPQHNYRVT